MSWKFPRPTFLISQNVHCPSLNELRVETRNALRPLFEKASAWIDASSALRRNSCGDQATLRVLVTIAAAGILLPHGIVFGQDDPLAQLDGTWAQIIPPGPPVIFTYDQFNMRALLPFIPGQAVVSLSHGLHNSDIQVSGDGDFVCYYQFLLFSRQGEFQWVYKGGNAECPKTALFRRLPTLENESETTKYHRAGLFPVGFDHGGPSATDRLTSSIGVLLPIALCGRSSL